LPKIEVNEIDILPRLPLKTKPKSFVERVTKKY